jgi:sucrose-6-phosphate hydrolase SacC (GH32 family)
MQKDSLLLASALFLAASAGAQSLDSLSSSLATTAPLYNEPYRPQYHYSPPMNFMNDPNGLVYFNGTYNLYFQWNSLTNVAGNQNWGHATSTDLIHWKNASPFIAIPYEPLTGGYIYSGSAVVDANNTSGFFNGTAGGGLVAIYTLATYPPFANPATQVQDIAYSLDSGITYTKYSGNPVLNVDNPNFRDPYVFWYPLTQRWIMAVSLANDHQILFYSSKNLKTWNYMSSFGPAGTLGVAYEVPNLIQVPIEGTNQRKWVLLVGINPGAPLGGSATQYFIGDFDGRRFKADDAVNRWMEFGKDAYAMETYNDLSNNVLATQSVIAITWVGNWQIRSASTDESLAQCSISGAISDSAADDERRVDTGAATDFARGAA